MISFSFSHFFIFNGFFDKKKNRVKNSVLNIIDDILLLPDITLWEYIYRLTIQLSQIIIYI